MSWKAISRSAIGTSHLKQHLPCQDYGSYQIFNKVIVGAVADGAGSAKYADIGAKLAVETVIEHFAKFEAYLRKRKHFWQKNIPPITEKYATKIFTKAVKKVAAVLKEQAITKGYSVNDLACTLLIVIATPTWIAAMQIGDGFIAVRFPDQLQVLFPPDKGEYINETTFVTSAKALKAMRVCVCEGKQEFICVATDGLEQVAIRMSDGTPFSPFFQPLEQYLQETPNPEMEDEYLSSFLNSDRLNARTNDDKTLLLCLYDNSNSH
ncbi:PP2C family serine/threonine-protein phosphatase [Gloeocapsopsis sp. IPPAS B-1203]|uniref:PP2C family serine/threonine-protein phosphatase n=1 Tax=Gloeocapsopsis sp. IPPAS B-1203 TaxID=2049454 RepID=UPI000C197A89|nr:PP2C family serine/threonine-protein phosphatase [Gloeocapsopsis sp. IPPAS B-1203]PIG94361.1 hypothetical protein CSQ79_03435 [Gloeocapsopsis sp. IPPAS B-1203]